MGEVPLYMAPGRVGSNAGLGLKPPPYGLKSLQARQGVLKAKAFPCIRAKHHLQGNLALEKHQTPEDHHKVPGMGLLLCPGGVRFRGNIEGPDGSLPMLFALRELSSD